MSEKDPNCIFCKIAAGEIPADVVYENDSAIAFNDASPKAPVHVLVIPKKHLPSLHAAGNEDRELLAELLFACREIAEKTGVSESGYRVLTNIGEDGGQSVRHLHFHVLGGRKLGLDV